MSRLFVALFTASPSPPARERVRGLEGEPDGIRTRDRPVKSRMLYLSKLRAL